ncbi:MAG: hypothetical protein ACXWLE_08185 [Rhizomicrobium sp.]
METFVFTGHVSMAKLAGLGNICIHFALLEMRIEQCIWAIRGHTRKTGRPLTPRQQIGKRCKVLKREAADKFGIDNKRYKFFEQVADIAELLAKDRNLFVHGLWSSGTAPEKRNKVYAISHFIKENGSGAEVTAAGLDILTANISNLAGVIARGIPKHLGVPLP